MKTLKSGPALIVLASLVFAFHSCEKTEQPLEGIPLKIDAGVNFKHKISIKVGGETAAEISAYDPDNKKLFIVNAESNAVYAYDISDLSNPVGPAVISLEGNGAPNSIAVNKGLLAVAVEGNVKQEPGRIQVYDARSLTLMNTYTVGSLPDMVTFSPNGKFIVCANEGEPSADYLNDPKGSVSIIKIATGEVYNLEFDAFNSEQAALELQGYRVFGPGADLAMDTEPEYVAISDNSQTAWVTLQENNGIAKINLNTAHIEAIFPLGFKDHSDPYNALDPSNEDGKKELNSWPVKGIFHPDGIVYVKIGGSDFLVTANEGDARDYDAFSEEARVKDIILDPTVFPNAAELQQEDMLGRLNITTTLGDTDSDGDFDELYSYGARSFTIWTGSGDLVYDSGSGIGEITLTETPGRFNDNDGRSDDKGGEPESVAVLERKNNQFILFVGLERNDQTLVYDISNPYAPQFLQILSTPGDEAPEGLLVVSAKESPSARELLIVSNEDSGTVTIYEN